MARNKMDARSGKPTPVVTPSKKTASKRGFYVLIALMAVLGITALSYLSTRPKELEMKWDSTLPRMAAEGHVIGSDSARVEVIEFGDFECPSCGRFATITEPDVRAKLVNSGLIRFRFLDFPLPMHRNTWHASNAAWCASEQNKFWEMHDAIFQNQDRWNGIATDNPDKVLAGVAQGVGLNVEQYTSCMAARKYQAQIQASVTEGTRRQIQGTPTFVFGTTMTGILSFDEFKAQVDRLLAEAAPKRK
jgi:protein-disulfide isomerase